MITKFENFLITESPDNLRHNKKSLHYRDGDAIPFFVTTNKNKNHTEVKKLYMDENKFGIMHGDIPGRHPNNRAYPGRIWLKSKVMSFWVYPNEKLFKSIIHKIEEKLGIKMFNNGWQIEVYKSGTGEINRREFDKNQGADQYYYNDYNGKRDVVPIEEYAGSEDAPEEEKIAHLMNWQEKEKLKKEKGVHGFGSDKTSWDRPHNIKWRQAIYQENKNN
jgi:hypothetical protein